MDPNGKIALVTGGASGIGLACTKELLSNGAKVTICDWNVKLGKDVLENLSKEFGKDKVLFVEVDVRDQESFEEVFKKTLSHFGGLDIVLNSAGIWNDAEWELEIDINLKGVIRGTLLGMKYLGKDSGGNGGIVVNIASVAGLSYFPTLPVYVATKHGVIAASQCLGAPFHYDQTGVRIGVLCPSKTDTPLLIGVNKKLLKPEWTEETTELMDGAFMIRTVESVAKCFMKMVQEAENGAVWVTDGEENYAIKFPDLKDMQVKL